jgi:hypothetical protein
MINHGKAWAEKGQICKILSPDEVANYCHIHRMQVEGFPKLPPDSIEAIWYGLLENQVVEIISNSVSSAGIACQTRRVASTKVIDVEELQEEES